MVVGYSNIWNRSTVDHPRSAHWYERSNLSPYIQLARMGYLIPFAVLDSVQPSTVKATSELVNTRSGPIAPQHQSSNSRPSWHSANPRLGHWAERPKGRSAYTHSLSRELTSDFRAYSRYVHDARGDSRSKHEGFMMGVIVGALATSRRSTLCSTRLPGRLRQRRGLS